jgi:GNAT superfamily N-acetyltransferase
VNSVNEAQEALAYFQRNPLRHLVHLKYLTHHSGSVDFRYLKTGASEAALLSGSVRTMSWDHNAYPDLELMLLPSASDELAAQQLVERVRAEFPLQAIPTLFKFCDPYSKAAFTTAMPLHPARAYRSFTTRDDTPVYQRHADVVAGHVLDDARAALYQQNGYTLDELQHYVDDGALTFAIYEGNDLASACFAYRNFGDIWEIAGVRSVDSARRKGYARKIVETALYELAARQLTPRYHVEVINAPSIGLAQSLDLEECALIEHFVSAEA